MITPDEALELVVRAAAPLAAQRVALDDACGLVLAEDILADRDYPPFPRSMMDGFAVRLADAGTTVPVVGEVPAGSVWEGQVVAGQCVEILTGAPCPRGAEAVVPKEHVARRENFVDLPNPIKPGQNIAPQGSDCRRAERVLAAGQVVTSMAIAAIASFGRASIQARPRPTLGVITTGEELAGPGGPLRPGQIRNSNGPMLAAMARDQGLSAPRHWHVADRLEATVQALEEAANTNIVVLSGGVSVGTYDFVPQALARIGAETVFHGVKQKPARPILLARQGPRLFFGLPGNPLSCHFGFHRYVAPAIRKMSGLAAARRVFQGELALAIESKGGRVRYVPGRAEVSQRSAGGWRVEVLPEASSADIFQGCRANCYVELPAVAHVYRAGEAIGFTWLGREPWW
jgi:molybdopterin molybdotransferase